MLFQIKTINGQKTIVPLTADAGTGAPVGSLIAMYKKSSPSGYLYCDGSTFDETKYPALYQYLGSNVLPDYREFALVGAEENTTDVYNASTNPTGTIHDHDVYTEGQAKDDQLQNHTHYVPTDQGTEQSQWVWKFGLKNGYSQDYWGDLIQGVYGARTGTVTRGKRKSVYFYIKATSGLTENQQENVLNTINENLSYSTTEHKTGKKWIDGKDIYERTFICSSQTVINANTWSDISQGFTGLSATMSEVDTLVTLGIKLSKAWDITNTVTYYANYPSVGSLSFFADIQNTLNPNSGILTLEYTKTNG